MAKMMISDKDILILRSKQKLDEQQKEQIVQAFRKNEIHNPILFLDEDLSIDILEIQSSKNKIGFEKT